MSLRTVSRLGLLGLSTLTAFACSSAPGVQQASDETSAPAQTAVATAPAARHTAFEPVAVAVPVGNACTLHPMGNLDPKQTIRVAVEADGVARFHAARARREGDVEHLTLDCTDAAGKKTGYDVDLRSDATFAPRPFDPIRAGYEARPVLHGDPMSYSPEELVAMGYGIRPDPEQNPAGYARWLDAAKTPTYEVRSLPRNGESIAPQPRKSASSVARAEIAHSSSAKPVAGATQPGKNAGVTAQGGVWCGGAPVGCYWTGAIMNGSYKAGSTAYLVNEGTFTVPTAVPGGNGTNKTEMSIWTGLDNVFQTIVWVSSTSSAASYSMDRQVHYPTVASSNSAYAEDAGQTFNPNAGDSVFVEEWYCDSSGNPSFTGGYACTSVVDKTRNLSWNCTKSNSTTCQSNKLVTDGVGSQAEFIVENDSDQDGLTYNWPDFGGTPITMSGSALVVKGSGAGSSLTQSSGWVNVSNDPSITLATDVAPPGDPVGSSYVNVTLGSGAVTWTNAPATPAWQSPSGTSIPLEALQMGTDTNGDALYSCYAQYDGSIQLGKTETGWGTCDIGYGGREIWSSPTSILGSAWQTGNNGSIPNSAVQLGSFSNGTELYPCRTQVDGGWQLGFIQSGGWCTIGFGGKEVGYESYEVLANPENIGFQQVNGPHAGALPEGAIRGGTDTDGTPLYVCLATSSTFGTAPGKTRANWGSCDVGYNGVENFVSSYTVLVPQFASATSGYPSGAYTPGTDSNGSPLGICTESYDSATQVGKALEGGNCHFGYGGSETSPSASYKVLMAN
jgi:hypothetical protein